MVQGEHTPELPCKAVAHSRARRTRCSLLDLIRDRLDRFDQSETCRQRRNSPRANAASFSLLGQMAVGVTPAASSSCIPAETAVLTNRRWLADNWGLSELGFWSRAARSDSKHCRAASAYRDSGAVPSPRSSCGTPEPEPCPRAVVFGDRSHQARFLSRGSWTGPGGADAAS